MTRPDISTRENAHAFIASWDDAHRRGAKKYLIRVGSGAIGSVIFLIAALIFIATVLHLYGPVYIYTTHFYTWLIVLFVVCYLAGVLIAYLVWRRREALYAKALRDFPRVRSPWDDPELSSRFTMELKHTRRKK